jgi:hypothetical protein
MRTELVFESNIACLLGFSVEEILILFKICNYRKIEEACVSLERKQSMLEAGVSSTLFPYEN